MCVTSFEVARLKGSLSCALNPLRARTPSCMESQMVQNSPGFHRRMIIKTPFS